MNFRICSFNEMKTAFSSGVSGGYHQLQGLCQKVAHIAKKIFVSLYNLFHLRKKSCLQGPLQPQVKEKCKINTLESAGIIHKIKTKGFSQEEAVEALSKYHEEDLFLMLIELIANKNCALIELFLKDKNLVTYLESDNKNATLDKRAKKVINEMEKCELKAKLEKLLNIETK